MCLEMLAHCENQNSSHVL